MQVLSSWWFLGLLALVLLPWPARWFCRRLGMSHQGIWESSLAKRLRSCSPSRSSPAMVGTEAAGKVPSKLEPEALDKR